MDKILFFDIDGARSIVAGSAVFYGNIYQNVCALRSEKAKP